MTFDEDYQPAALTFEANGRMDPALSAEDATALFNGIVGDLTRASAKAGAWMIGHVKAVLVAEPGGMLTISSTTEDGKVRNRETLGGPVEDYAFRANVIVYGISEEQVLEVSKDYLREALPQAVIQMIGEDCEDPECDDPDCHDPSHRVIIPIS